MEKIDLAFFGYIGLATICVAVTIILVTNRAAWMPAVRRFVSTISSGWQSSIERARHQKEARDRLYGYAAEPVLYYNQTSSRSSSTSSRDPVPGQQHRQEPREPGESEPDQKSFARQLAKEELIILLAVQRNDEGGYLYSANQITSFVGGTAAPIKATIANVRGKKEQPAPMKSLHRPLNGW